jgi:hypothetical protein
MRQVSRYKLLMIVFLVGTSWVLSSCTSNQQDDSKVTPIPVWEYKNETAFDTVYPEGWVQDIIFQGFLAFAPPEVAYESESGPSMSILREPYNRLISPLEEELNHFLEYGPLREDYFLISSISPIKIGQYDGLEVALEREATEMFIAMKSVISVTQTDSGSLYTFIATAPTEQWDDSWPLLLTITQNITFNE